MTVFASYAAYYDLLNAGKDYAAEAEYVEGLLRAVGEGRTILELGCGTGMHASLLAQRGFEIMGVDRSESMLAAAKQRAAALPQDVASRLSFAHGDACTFRAERTFDYVVSLFHVISYQTAQHDLEAAFATARAHLRPGGAFVFDCWYGPAVLTERPERRTKELENDAVKVTRYAVPELHANENVVDVNYTIEVREKASGRVEEIRERHEMRYLFAPEVEALLRHAGFRLHRCEEWLTGRPMGFDTWGVVFVGIAV